MEAVLKLTMSGSDARVTWRQLLNGLLLSGLLAYMYTCSLHQGSNIEGRPKGKDTQYHNGTQGNIIWETPTPAPVSEVEIHEHFRFTVQKTPEALLLQTSAVANPNTARTLESTDIPKYIWGRLTAETEKLPLVETPAIFITGSKTRLPKPDIWISEPEILIPNPEDLSEAEEPEFLPPEPEDQAGTIVPSMPAAEPEELPGTQDNQTAASPEMVTVCLHGNGGTPDVTTYESRLEDIDKETWLTPRRLGKVFDRWYLDPACTQPYDKNPDEAVYLDIYAGWKEFDGFISNDAGHITGYTSLSVIADGILTFPDSPDCTGVESQALDGLSEVMEVYIPANITYIGPGVFDSLTELMYIEVAEDNPSYYSDCGELYTIDGELVACPAGWW